MCIRTLAILALLWLAGCGSAASTREGVVVRIGASTIAGAELTHWMSALALGHRVSPPPRYTACVAHERKLTPSLGEAELHGKCKARYQQLREQALGLLISWRWVVAEAARRGVGVSAREVHEQLMQKQRSYAGGAGEFHESLKAIEHTVPDVEAEIRAELAAQKIKQKLIAGETQLTPADVATYYSHHIALYHLEERRDFDIVENLRRAAFARKLKREFAHGRDIVNASLQQSQLRSAYTHVIEGEKRIIENAIFHARLNVVTGPIHINGYYFLVKVTRITPPRQQPLSEVREAIATKLTTERRRHALAAFIAVWRSRWTSLTDCAPGYVVQKCKQYSGNSSVEDPLGFG